MGKQKHSHLLMSQIELRNPLLGGVEAFKRGILGANCIVVAEASVWLLPRSPRLPGLAPSLVFLNTASVLADLRKLSLFEVFFFFV